MGTVIFHLHPHFRGNVKNYLFFHKDLSKFPPFFTAICSFYVPCGVDFMDNFDLCEELEEGSLFSDRSSARISWREKR